MTVDTSIYGRLREFKLEDPMEIQAKALELRKAQKGARLDRDIEELGRETGGDPEKMSAGLLSRGHYEPAMKLRSQAAAQKKAQLDEHLKIVEAVGGDAMTLDTMYRQALQESGGNREAAITRVQPVYAQVASKWTKLGHQMSPQFDPDETFSAIGQAKERAAYLKSLHPEFGSPTNAINPANGQPELYQPPKGAGQGRFLGVQPAASPAQPTELARYQAERAAMQPGDPRIPEHDRVIANFKGGRGTDITVQQPGPMVPGKAAQNKVDEDLLGVTRNLMQIEQISGMFKPEYQRWGDRAAFAGLKVKDSTVGLDAREKKDLTEFSQYRRNAFGMLNEYIKNITGAALSVAEANRIMKAMPNPGEGMFDGDSPTEFKAKMDDVLKQTKLAVARLAYIKRNGMSLTDQAGNAVVPLERMPSVMKERGRAIEAELRRTSPNATDAGLKKAIQMQLSQEFGLVE
jgi:hypothetical protein